MRLTSPKSLEACRRLGIVPHELSRIPYEEIEQEVKQQRRDNRTLSSPGKSPP